MNKLKWFVVILGFSAISFGNIYFGDKALALRLSFIVIAGLVLLWIATKTTQGDVALGFLKQSKSEIRRVVWPSRKETVNTTFMVVVAVGFVGLILWGVDSLFIYLTQLLVA